MARSKGMTKTGGRRKGTPNKLTVDLKEMILGALNAKGGQRYLEQQATENPVAFLVLVGKILPLTLQGNSQQPITFQVVTGVSRTVDANDRACRENTEDGPPGPVHWWAHFSVGGYGSSWQGSKKTTVEDGLCLSMSSLVKKKALVAGSWTRGSWQWSYEGSEPHARIGYEANLVDAEAAWLRLTYTASGNPMDYRVRLVTTEPTYGGCRWWFLCPLARQDGGPPRRVAKLYLPPAGGISEAAKRTSSPKRRARRAGNSTGSIDGWLPI